VLKGVMLADEETFEIQFLPGGLEQLSLSMMISRACSSITLQHAEQSNTSDSRH